MQVLVSFLEQHVTLTNAMFAGIACWLLYKFLLKRYVIKTGRVAVGTVARIAREPDFDGGTTEVAKISYQDGMGVERTLSTPVVELSSNLGVGDTVRVHFDPDTPSRSYATH